MDYTKLKQSTFTEFKKMANELNLPSRRSREEYYEDIKKCFFEYEKYKHEKIDKYTKIKQLGNKGKEGITYLVTTKTNVEFAMKTFRQTKSSTTLKTEYFLQKQAATQGISPRVVEYDTISKYIVMEKMDTHLVDLMKNQKGTLSRQQQQQIIDIYKKLDIAKVFHGDSNILNYMLKDNKIYIIDFGFSKEINSKLIKKLGTDCPNLRIMTLGFILKLKEMKCSPSSWKVLKKYVSTEEIENFSL
jgi:tRNA A-37 threonylcarbamoyl transferase component Bud32